MVSNKISQKQMITIKKAADLGDVYAYEYFEKAAKNNDPYALFAVGSF